MRCAECGAKIAATAGVCARCRAPVVAQWLIANSAVLAPDDDLETAPAAPADATWRPARPRVRQVVWALMPIVSLTTLASVPFLWLALVRRRGRDWQVFGAYALALVIEIGGVLLLTQGYTVGVIGPWLFWIVLIVAPIHALVTFSPGADVPSWRDSYAVWAASKAREPVMDAPSPEL